MLSGKEYSMNLLITIDKNYLSQVKTMLHSVRWANPGVELQVYLLHSSLSPAHCRELKNFLLGQDIQLHAIEIGDQELDNAPVTNRYPKEMYYRIFAARYLPSNIDRVLYLDPDLIVINSLEQLYQTPMEGYYFAAATHVKAFFRKINQLRLEEYEDGPYINSGVMLMNLTLLRKKQDFFTVIQFLEKHQTGLLLPDQDLLSGLYGPHILLLDEYRYNMTERLFFFRPEAEAFWDLDWVRKNSAIIHYCGRNKPWKKNYIGKLDIFYREAAQRLSDSQTEKSSAFSSLIKPPQLFLGDAIAIVAPCSTYTTEQAMKTKNTLEQLGFSVSLSPNLCSSTWEFSATLKERIADFQQAVLDEHIKMIFFGGGEVGNQLLPYLDYESIRQHPKIYCSYSDGTSILNAIYCRTGLVTFYGNAPERMSPSTPYDWTCFQKQFMRGQLSYEKASQWIPITPGKAKGTLIGGYLLNFAFIAK